MVGLVVGGCDVEGVEQLSELSRLVALELGAEVGDGGEHGLDLFGPGAERAGGFEVGDGLGGGVAAGAEFGDALFGEGDDGVVGVVVFFEAQGLAVQGALGLLQFAAKALEVGVVLGPGGGDGVGELVAQQRQALGAEDAPGEEVERVLEDDVLLDAEHAGVSGGVGAGDAAARDELAAVPVVALLVAAFHASAAQAAAHPAAEGVEAAVALAVALPVRLGEWRFGAVLVGVGAVLDALEELAGDDRLVDRGGAPDPLLAGAHERPAAALVVAAPDVVAGVLGVPQKRPQLRATPGRGQRHVVLAVAPRRRVALEVRVELVAQLAEPEAVQAVVLEDHLNDRGAQRVGEQAVLLLALARLLRIGVRVLLELVAVGDGAAHVPALTGALFHPAAASLDEVADVPLGHALLDATRKDRRRARADRLVGGEQADVVVLELALDAGGVGGHARQAVDRLDDHRVKASSVGRGVQQVAQAAVTGHLHGAPIGAVSALGERFAAAFDVPEAGDDLASAGLERALTRGELTGDRQRRVLGIIG